MPGMRLGGVDPSIIRELSGVCKPFVKAFKELVSHAFDADADHVVIEFAALHRQSRASALKGAVVEGTLPGSRQDRRPVAGKASQAIALPTV